MLDTLPAKNETHKPKLLEEVRRIRRLKHYSVRTEKAYLDWIRRYLAHHRMRHPREMGAAEVGAFLSHLAADLKPHSQFRESLMRKSHHAVDGATPSEERW